MWQDLQEGILEEFAQVQAMNPRTRSQESLLYDRYKKVSEDNKEDYEAKAEERRRKRMERYYANRELEMAKIKAYQKANPEKVKAWHARTAARRAKAA